MQNDGLGNITSTLEIRFDDWHQDSEISGLSNWDSETASGLIDGNDGYGFSGTEVEYIELEYEGSFISSLEDYHFEGIGKITISIGVVELQKDESIDLMFKRVDDLLYLSKSEGRNKISC